MCNLIGISFDSIDVISVATTTRGEINYRHIRALTKDGFEPHWSAKSFQDSNQRFRFVRCTPNSTAANRMVPANQVSLPGFRQALAEYQAWYNQNYPRIPCELNDFQQWVYNTINQHPEDVHIDLSLAFT